MHVPPKHMSARCRELPPLESLGLCLLGMRMSEPSQLRLPVTISLHRWAVELSPRTGQVRRGGVRVDPSGCPEPGPGKPPGHGCSTTPPAHPQPSPPDHLPRRRHNQGTKWRTRMRRRTLSHEHPQPASHQPRPHDPTQPIGGSGLSGRNAILKHRHDHKTAATRASAETPTEDHRFFGNRACAT